MWILIATFGCKQPPPTMSPDTGGYEDSPCGTASERYGDLVCLHRLGRFEDLERLVVADADADVVFSTRFFVATDGARLPTLFPNSRVLPEDPEFFVEAFGGRFGELTEQDYDSLVLGADREFSTGMLGIRTDSRSGDPYLGFTIAESEPLSVDEIATVWRDLRDRMGFDVPVFVPQGDQIQRAEAWDAPFPIAAAGPKLLEYQSYSAGPGYGVVRIWDEDQLELQTDTLGYGAEDLLVLEEAPFNIGLVSAGVVTATPLPVLSPSNLRAAERGTPSCYDPAAAERFALFVGQLVRVECAEAGLSIELATWPEATEFWESRAPSPLVPVTPDSSDAAVLGLEDLSLGSAAQRSAAVARFGTQGVELGYAAQQGSGPVLRGFVLPAQVYEDFLTRNRFIAEIGGGLVLVSFREALDAWFADPLFIEDRALQAERLGAMSEAMALGVLDPNLLSQLRDPVVEAVGSTEFAMRFRSSGTADRGMGLSLDGLERSVVGCLADDLDGDFVGPSRCDPSDPDERTVATAVAAVYANLWRARALDERARWSLPLDAVSSGVLGVERVRGELADIRAFTIDPLTGEPGFLISAAAGEGSAVDKDYRVLAEVSRLVPVGAGLQITREQASSTVPTGDLVLSDAELVVLAGRLQELLDLEPGQAAHLDTRWKLLESGEFLLTSVRSFDR